MQRLVLIDLFVRAHSESDRFGWGVPIGKPDRRWGAVSSASYSRALRRLEERGLLLRQSQASGNPFTGRARRSPAEPHTRTTHIQLTPLGVAVARWCGRSF